MGGDFGPPVSVAASLVALEKYPSLELILFGQEPLISEHLNKSNQSLKQRVTIRHCEDVVTMDDKPSVALRSKKDSSLRKSLESVADGHAHACVSAGNTGALMALSRFILKMIPGIDRPAIITAIPNQNRHTFMLDLGANVDCCAETLFQFAIMGSVLAQAVDNNPRPKVGLLNIGEEEIKGNDEVKLAAKLLQAFDGINYSGFVEGNDIYSGKVDVIVCDGYTGNNVLKASEGLVKLITLRLRQVFESNWLFKMVGLMTRPILRIFKEQLDPDRYNGATLIGLKGIVVKSHGSASVAATVSAIEAAIKEVEHEVPQKIAEQVEQHLNART